MGHHINSTMEMEHDRDLLSRLSLWDGDLGCPHIAMGLLGPGVAQSQGYILCLDSIVGQGISLNQLNVSIFLFHYF